MPFEEIESHFSPAEHKAFVAITYTQLNRVRARLYRQAKLKGFELVSYVSSRAFVWRNVTVGDNVFVFENNVIQHFAEIGNNVILWSGNHIGHRTVIEDNCYLTSHVVVSGYCRIQQYSFVGVNVTIADRVTIARDCFIGAGCVIAKDTEPGKVYYAAPAAGRQGRQPALHEGEGSRSSVRSVMNCGCVLALAALHDPASQRPRDQRLDRSLHHPRGRTSAWPARRIRSRAAHFVRDPNSPSSGRPGSDRRIETRSAVMMRPPGRTARLSSDNRLRRFVVIEMMQHRDHDRGVEGLMAAKFQFLERRGVEIAASGKPLLCEGDIVRADIVSDILDACGQIRHDLAGTATDVENALPGFRANVVIDEITPELPAPTAVCSAL